MNKSITRRQAIKLGLTTLAASSVPLTAAFGDIRDFWADAFPEAYGAPFEPLAGGIFAAYPSRQEAIPGCGTDTGSTYQEVADLGAFYCILGDFMAYDDASLLPAFTGLNTHARALTEGVKIHGCTVHFVTPNLDKGPIIVQAAVPVLPGDTEDTLGARVLEQEHKIYPQAIRWFAEGRLTVTPDCNVILQNQRPAETALRSPWEAQ